MTLTKKALGAVCALTMILHLHSARASDWLFEFSETGATRSDVVASGWMMINDSAFHNGFSISASYGDAFSSYASGPSDLHNLGIDAMYFDGGGDNVTLGLTLDSFYAPNPAWGFPSWNFQVSSSPMGTPTGEIDYIDVHDADEIKLHLQGVASNGEFYSDRTALCGSHGNGPDCAFNGSFQLQGQVPEPGNVALFGLGLVAFMAARKRRSSH